MAKWQKKLELIDMMERWNCHKAEQKIKLGGFLTPVAQCPVREAVGRRVLDVTPGW